MVVARGTGAMVIHERTQHPVGQGFFHSAFVIGERGPLHYVVDCGSMTRYAAARNARVREYIKGLRPCRELDILYITHFHVDHVSGLEELLDETRGLRVGTIVMPLLNDIDRLIAFARSYVEDRVSAETEFYRSLIANPSSAVSRFNPRRIVFVQPGRGDGGAPGSIDTPTGPFDLDLSAREDTAEAWKFTGRGKVGRYPDGSTDNIDGTGALVAPDTTAVVISSFCGEWLLAPFVDPGISRDQTKFLQALAKERGLSLRMLKKWLEDIENLQTLLTSDVADLVTAYRAVTVDLNSTSLCLYSGPVNGFCGESIATSGAQRWWLFSHRVAWLGTGDAALASGKRRKAFLKHYGHLLNNVGILTLPHHGSETNFHDELLTKIRPRLTVAAADKYSTWRHPGAHVVQSVCSHGSAVHVVTSKLPSSLREYVKLR